MEAVQDVPEPVEARNPLEPSAGKFEELATALRITCPVLRAVAEVESSGKGFIRQMQPKILFEGHAFHKLTGGRFSASHPDVSYPKWDRRKYSGTLLGEWDRLEKASLLDRPAALQSASWGLFQIMGFNYAYCGASDVEAFVAMQCESADAQLELFARFIARPPFLAALRAITGPSGNDDHWEVFARAYNGPLHAKNNYVGKLHRAHLRHLSTDRRRTAGAAPRPQAAPGERTGLAPGRIAFAPVSKTQRRTPEHQRNVRPDSVDLRDWEYRPNIALVPPTQLLPNNPRPSRHQADSNACTGFALAMVIEYLLARSDRPVERLSGFMLYDMARRYDEWAESDPTEDSGSSVRGALKGWSAHGVSCEDTWPSLDMPRASNISDDDWWLDAVKRPLGSYYRISPGNIRDIHIALAEVGVVYASAFTHAGWDALNRRKPHRMPTHVDEVPAIAPKRGLHDQGHAFAIIGYSPKGLIIQNSWGDEWGAGGIALLAYEDWIANAMDCWVVQLGVVTEDNESVSGTARLRTDANGKVSLSRNIELADHEISPHIINMENNGRLSTRGRFRTSKEDVAMMVDFQMEAAHQEWTAAGETGMDVAIYAHGGLNDEDAAACAARYWLPYLYQHRIFPVFLMWETGALKTFNNILQDAVFGADARTAGGRWDKVKERIEDWKNERLEGLARWPGKKLWNEMKENADLLSRRNESGAGLLLSSMRQAIDEGRLPGNTRVHLIGHSAGAIAHSHLAPRIRDAGFDLASISLLAPAVRIDTFQSLLGDLLSEGQVRLLIAHLTDAAERSDLSCRPYGHSLLYLVSRSFEDSEPTPLLGMERHLTPLLPTIDWAERVNLLPSPGGSWDASSGVTRACTHGDMDNDQAIRAAVTTFIRFGGRRASAQ